MKVQAPSPLLRLAGIRYLARHKWQALLALAGIALGVAVVVAVDLANAASRQAFTEAAEQLRGDTTHRIVNPAGLVPETLYTDLATAPGHPPMAPVIEARIAIAGQSGRIRLLGLDLFAEGSFRSMLGEAVQGQATLADWLSTPGAVALSESAAATLGVGMGETFLARHGERQMPLTLLATYPDSSRSTADLVIVDIATAQALTGMRGQLSYIDLALDAPQQRWVADRLPAQVTVVDAREQAAGVAGMSAAFELNLLAMGLLALLVGLFLIYNAMTFSVVQRRNLLGRLRALGVTSRETFLTVMFEATVLAVIGTLLGGLLGIALAHLLLDIVSGTVSSLYYETGQAELTLSPLVLMKGAVLGLGGTLLATWIPARQAAATPPLTTLSRSALEVSARRLTPVVGLTGGVLVLAGLLIALVLPGGMVMGFVGLFLLLLGAAMMTPLSLRLLPRLLAPWPLGAIARMTLRDLDRHLSRLATATAALMIALSASIGVAVMVESMRGSVSVWLDSLLNADLYVTAVEFEQNAPLPEQAVDTVTRLPGVAGVSLYRDREITLDNQPLTLVGTQLHPRSRSGFRFIDSTPESAWPAYDKGDVLISESLAFHKGLAAGETLSLPTAAGTVPFRIAGVFQDYASERGRVFVALGAYRHHWRDDRVDTIALFAAKNSSSRWLDETRAQLSADYDLSFVAAREIYDESLRIFDRTFKITEVLRYLSLFVAFIGVFSALMAIQLERRREYAVLRALGFTGRQIGGMILMQATWLGMIAGIVAIPTGLAMAWILTDSIQLRAFGWSMQYVVPLVPVGTSVVLGIVAAFCAAVYPMLQSAKQNPAMQLRSD
jgi:putative ABC transport system permease protein